MRSILGRAVLVAAVAIGAHTAKADIYTYTSPFSGGGQDYGGEAYFNAQPFDTNLGTLDAVALGFSGGVGISFSDANRPFGGPLFITNWPVGVNVIGAGFIAGPGGYVPDAGTISGVGTNDSVMANGSFSAIFNVPTDKLNYYTDPAYAGILTGASIGIGVNDVLVPQDQRVGFGGSDTRFGGTFTETFTYTPTSVPEPGSLALLGTAGVMLAGAARLTRRRGRRS